MIIIVIIVVIIRNGGSPLPDWASHIDGELLIELDSIQKGQLLSTQINTLLYLGSDGLTYSFQYQPSVYRSGTCTRPWGESRE